MFKAGLPILERLTEDIILLSKVKKRQGGGQLLFQDTDCKLYFIRKQDVKFTWSLWLIIKHQIKMKKQKNIRTHSKVTLIKFSIIRTNINPHKSKLSDQGISIKRFVCVANNCISAQNFGEQSELGTFQLRSGCATSPSLFIPSLLMASAAARVPGRGLRSC